MKLNRFLILFFAVSVLCSISAFAAECPSCGGGNYWEEYVPPSCIIEGYDYYRCSDCGIFYFGDLYPLGHSYKETDRVEPNGGQNGSITYVCDRCGDISYSELEAVSPVPSETAALAKTLFSGVWGFFGVYVPGFGFTIGQLWLGIAICSISVGVLRLLLGLGGSGVSSRTGSTNNPKISDNRKGDEY